MGGTWSPTSPPSDPGFYVNFEAMATATVSGGQTGVVLIPLHDAVWGPVGTAQRFYSLAEYDRVFSKADTAGRRSVSNAFEASGYRPGAAEVIAFRIDSETQSGSKSTASVAGLTLEAVYVGDFINGWEVAVSPPNPGTGDVSITLTDATNVVRWEGVFDDGDDGEVISNQWFKATGTLAAAAVADSFVGGANPDPTVDEVMAAVETNMLNNDFNVITTDDFDDATAPASGNIYAAIVGLTDDINLQGKRFLAVVGGAKDESIDDAVAAAVAINNENIVRVGYTDLLDGDGNVVSTAEFAPKLAGIIASNGPFRSITANHISGMRVSQKATKADLRKARNAGVVMLVEDQIGARLYQDMTTFTMETMTKPRKEFGVIKAVMVHHQIENDLTRAAESGWIGGDNVNTDMYRRAVLDGIRTYLTRIEGAAMIQPNWAVGLDDEYDNSGDSIHIKYGIKTTRVVERILNTIVLH